MWGCARGRAVVVGVLCAVLLAAGCVADEDASGEDAAVGGAGGGAGGGGGGAGGVSCPPPAVDVSATPREDTRLETLALYLSEGLIAEQPTYERLVRDVDAIEALDPAMRNVGVYFPNAALGREISVQMRAADLPAAGTAEADAWRCLNEAMGVSAITPYHGNALQPGHWSGKLEFRGLFRLEDLAALYAALPFVRNASPTGPGGGDASTICVTVGDAEWRYFFDEAGGDCPAGCSEHVVDAFTVTTEGVVTHLGTWADGPAIDSDWPVWLAPELRAAGCL